MLDMAEVFWCRHQESNPGPTDYKTLSRRLAVAHTATNQRVTSIFLLTGAPFGTSL